MPIRDFSLGSVIIRLAMPAPDHPLDPRPNAMRAFLAKHRGGVVDIAGLHDGSIAKRLMLEALSARRNQAKTRHNTVVGAAVLSESGAIYSAGNLHIDNNLKDCAEKSAVITLRAMEGSNAKIAAIALTAAKRDGAVIPVLKMCAHCNAETTFQVLGNHEAVTTKQNRALDAVAIFMHTNGDPSMLVTTLAEKRELHAICATTATTDLIPAIGIGIDFVPGR